MATPDPHAEAPPGDQAVAPWRSTLLLALVGGGLLWLAQPPAMLSLLAWIAPGPWVWIASRPQRLAAGSYAAVWLAGAAYWAAALYWVCLPHPYTPWGLPPLAVYLGAYLPVFVWLTRVGVRRVGAPVWLAAPVAWVGLEWVQAHLLSGFLMAGLAHTQAWWPSVIQVASVGGAYAVSLVMMGFAAGVADGLRRLAARRYGTLPLDPRPPVGFFAATLPVAMTLYAGHAQLRPPGGGAPGGEGGAPAATPEATLALLQSDTRATWDPAPDRDQRIMNRLYALTEQAVTRASRAGRRLDLIVWPESMFRAPLLTFDGSPTPPTGLDPGQAALAGRAEQITRSLAAMSATPMLVGIDQIDYALPLARDPAEWRARFHNSAALTDASGRFSGVYAKVHRVPFGEYVPLMGHLPAMRFLTDIPRGLEPGDGPVAMEVRRRAGAAPAPARRLIVSPNICYETVIPHVIRRQVRRLQREGTPPDLLVNLTNNAWFWGSSELEQHLACGVLRAVENGTPLVCAANGGLTAAIDARGRVLALSRRMREEVILTDVPLTAYATFYTRWGDVVALPCLIACVPLAILGVRREKHR